MREIDFLEALGRVDQKYIDEVVISELRSGSPKKRRGFHAGGIISIAACAVIVCATVFVLKNNFIGRSPGEFLIKDGVLIAYSGASESVTIPDQVVSIADGAFASNENAGNIKQLTLSASLTDLEAADLEGLTGLEAIDAGKSKAFTELDGALISNCGEVLLSGSDPAATEYSIPDGVLYIAPCAFTSYPLESVDFGESIEYIGFNAFASTELESIILPDSVKEIAPGAFSWCVKAVEGYIPVGAKYYDNSFDSVPFFIKETTGENPPSADVANGMTPSEAIKLSDTEKFTQDVNALLKKIHDSKINETGKYIIEMNGYSFFVYNKYIDELPEEVNFSDLEFSDDGWGGNGLYDLRADIVMDGFRLCMEARAISFYDKTSWSDVEFSIENVYFLDDEPEYTFDIGDGWVASIDRDVGQGYVPIILKNGEKQIATFEKFDAQAKFEFLLSPGGKYLAITYGRDGVDSLFIQSLCGNVFQGFDYMFYVDRYYGQLKGGIEWVDAETLNGENEFGRFEWKMSEITPTQIIDDIPTGTKEVICDSERGDFSVKMTIPASWFDRGYFSDMQREKDKLDSTSRMLRNNGMYTNGLLTPFGEWKPSALEGTGWIYDTSVVTYGKTDQGLEYMQITTYYPDSYDKYTSYILAFRKGYTIAFTMEFTSYGDDPEGYYTDVILPVIKSVEITDK